MKNLHKFFITLSVVFFLFGCSQNIDEFPIESNDLMDVPEINPVTRIISAEQAKAFGDLAIEAIQKQNETPATTRSQGILTSTEVLTILADNGQPALYAVNFGDEQGFMIISADKESTATMLAFNDTGRFDPETLDEDSPMAYWIEEQKDIISKGIAVGINRERESYEMWESFNGDPDVTIEIELVNLGDAGDLIPTTRGRHKDSKGLAQVSVGWEIYNNLWGQGRGYNADAPRPGVDLVGCPAVAVGILCSYHWFPSGYEYWNMPTTLNTNSSNAISRMFRDIANRMPGYSWGSNTSGATEGAIVTGLRSLGYSNAVSGAYNFNTVYNNIKDRKPVLLGGFSNNVGHIWVADGYWEQVWKVTRKFLGIKVKTWYEYQDHFYMNWGWNGSSNAWVDQESWPTYNSNRRMWYNLNPVR